MSGIRVDTVETCGVVQPKVTITYRFEKPNELERAVPRTSLPTAIRIPVNPVTIGDHLRLRRLKLKADAEAGRHRAARRRPDQHSQLGKQPLAAEREAQMPAIIEFLGYNPLPPATTLAERLSPRSNVSLGLTQKESAKRIGVDPSTLARWERGDKGPTGDFVARVMRFLAKAEDTKREPGRGAKPVLLSGDVRQLA